MAVWRPFNVGAIYTYAGAKRRHILSIRNEQGDVTRAWGNDTSSPLNQRCVVMCGLLWCRALPMYHPREVSPRRRNKCRRLAARRAHITALGTCRANALNVVGNDDRKKQKSKLSTCAIKCKTTFFEKICATVLSPELVYANGRRVREESGSVQHTRARRRSVGRSSTCTRRRGWARRSEPTMDSTASPTQIEAVSSSMTERLDPSLAQIAADRTRSDCISLVRCDAPTADRTPHRQMRRARYGPAPHICGVLRRAAWTRDVGADAPTLTRPLPVNSSHRRP
ncbi:hypothetical protein B0H19DRAFT_1334929 [Mycena capillaripes]|nr:hypothetical protein B0H19DRAFT_1334929 [Mycena capillaripes]